MIQDDFETHKQQRGWRLVQCILFVLAQVKRGDWVCRGWVEVCRLEPCSIASSFPIVEVEESTLREKARVVLDARLGMV